MKYLRGATFQNTGRSPTSRAVLRRQLAREVGQVGSGNLWSKAAEPHLGLEASLWLDLPAALTKEIARPHIPKISRSLTRENLHITTTRLSTTTQVSLMVLYDFSVRFDTNLNSLQRHRQNEYVYQSLIACPLLSYSIPVTFTTPTSRLPD